MKFTVFAVCLFLLACKLPEGQDFLSVVFTDTFLGHKRPTIKCVLNDWPNDGLAEWRYFLPPCRSLQDQPHIKDDSCVVPSLLSGPLTQTHPETEILAEKQREKSGQMEKDTRLMQGKTHSSYLQTSKEMGNHKMWQINTQLYCWEPTRCQT